jgi:Icc-related predicted phosphoesterase
MEPRRVDLPPVRVLLASDLHYNLRHFDWLLGEADEFDVTVLAGDHLDILSPVALNSQWVVVLQYLQRMADRTTVVASSGNHDLTARNAHGEKAAAWLLDGRRVGALVDWDSLDVDSVRITVCPWWDGPLTRDDVDAQLRDQARDRPAQWVWVYHPPPSGSTTAKGTHRDYGDDELRSWIVEHQPEVVLSGHVHEAPFTNGGSWAERIGTTWTFNPGRLAMGPVPNHVVLDLGLGTASWYGGGETAEITLGQ